jgi:hypothetical protein
LFSITRRQFLKSAVTVTAAMLLSTFFKRLTLSVQAQNQSRHIYIARNGTPTTNVQQVVALAGGIQSYISTNDVVVLKPNGQWPRQGYTHTESLKALIDVILNHPGGFAGEIIIIERVHSNPTKTLNDSSCWNMSAGSNRLNNWPAMNYFELVNDYHARGIPNVTAIPLYDSGEENFVTVSGPADLSGSQHGWVRTTYTTAANGRTCCLSHPILHSAYSGNLIDLKTAPGSTAAIPVNKSN